MEITDIDLYGGPLDGLAFSCPTQLIDGLITAAIPIIQDSGGIRVGGVNEHTHVAIYLKHPTELKLHYKETNVRSTDLSKFDQFQPKHRQPGPDQGTGGTDD